MDDADGFPKRAEGIEAIKAKGEQWAQMVESFHGIEIEGPIVAGNHFTAAMKIDVTFKGAPRVTNEQIALFEVKDGKVVLEQFFYTM